MMPSCKNMENYIGPVLLHIVSCQGRLHMLEHENRSKSTFEEYRDVEKRLNTYFTCACIQATNYGSRIDYVLTSSRLIRGLDESHAGDLKVCRDDSQYPYLVNANILPDVSCALRPVCPIMIKSFRRQRHAKIHLQVLGSDHCPTYCVLSVQKCDLAQALKQPKGQ